MFDPFKDFERAGYLRNRFGEENPEIVKQLEHQLFRAGLDDALTYLSRRKALGYEDFLEVHKILFSAFYPWAGQDRTITAPHVAVSKAGTLFSHPLDSRRAVEAGLRIAGDRRRLRERAGEVMGLFAYGHPFLDGNGRTILVIHSELCHRAGFCIEWHRTAKNGYLDALSREIAAPGRGILDGYLAPFVGVRQQRQHWGGVIDGLSGLGGLAVEDVVEGEYGDAKVSRKYQDFERQRGYSMLPEA